jgi:hypothetical protein
VQRSDFAALLPLSYFQIPHSLAPPRAWTFGISTHWQPRAACAFSSFLGSHRLWAPSVININSALQFAGLKMAESILAISRAVSYSASRTPISIPCFCRASVLQHYDFLPALSVLDPTRATPSCGYNLTFVQSARPAYPHGDVWTCLATANACCLDMPESRPA